MQSRIIKVCHRLKFAGLAPFSIRIHGSSLSECSDYCAPEIPELTYNQKDSLMPKSCFLSGFFRDGMQDASATSTNDPQNTAAPFMRATFHRKNKQSQITDNSKSLIMRSSQVDAQVLEKELKSLIKSQLIVAVSPVDRLKKVNEII